MTKKETQMLNREKVKLADQHRGIKDMRRLPDALVIVDAQYEDTAIREASRLEIPVIAIVDTNTNPNKVDYPIPANDDSMRTIQLIISAIADTIVETRQKSSDQAEKLNKDTQAEDKSVKNRSTIQNTLQKNNKSIPETEGDYLSEEEE